MDRKTSRDWWYINIKVITYHTQTMDIHNKKKHALLIYGVWLELARFTGYYIAHLHTHHNLLLLNSESMNYPGKLYRSLMPSHYRSCWNSWHLNWYFHIKPVNKYFEDSKPMRGRLNCLLLLASNKPIAHLPTGLWLLHCEIICNTRVDASFKKCELFQTEVTNAHMNRKSRNGKVSKATRVL